MKDSYKSTFKASKLFLITLKATMQHRRRSDTVKSLLQEPLELLLPQASFLRQFVRSPIELSLVQWAKSHDHLNQMDPIFDLKDEFLSSRFRHIPRNKHDVPIASEPTRSTVSYGYCCCMVMDAECQKYSRWPSANASHQLSLCRCKMKISQGLAEDVLDASSRIVNLVGMNYYLQKYMNPFYGLRYLKKWVSSSTYAYFQVHLGSSLDQFIYPLVRFGIKMRSMVQSWQGALHMVWQRKTSSDRI